MLRILLVCTAIVFAGLCMAGLWIALPMLVVGAGYKAKILCSGIFVSGRDPMDVVDQDLSVDDLAGLWFFPHGIDRAAQEVTVSLPGLIHRRAVFRPGRGCSLISGSDNQELFVTQKEVQSLSPTISESMLWPRGRRTDPTSLSGDVDKKRLAAAVKIAFAEPNPEALQRTRAVVVVHRGGIVAERYAQGFDEATAQLGWSMSKSALNALVGAIVHRYPNRWALSRTNLLPEWSGDDRAQISLENLLRMRSGLSFTEAYKDYSSDVMTMLFRTNDAGAFAASKPLASKPGSTWSYSSGSSNIISYVLRRRARRVYDYLTLPASMLFAPLDMRHAVFETDAAGIFTASSFMYATPRDWARLGLLYLQDGVWNGRRLLPENWVAQSLNPTPSAPDDQYGMHLWLKLPDESRSGEPPLPSDAYYMLGHAGQVVAVIPSRELVIVRMGLARAPGAWRPVEVLSKIVGAFPTTR